MSYQVIARKYRPQRFSDVVGQEHVTQTLINAIRQSRIAHAYLFVGPRGTGKTTIARIFAKCLNCTGGPKEDYPDEDPRCIEITEGRSLDVMEIDGASNRGIEEIRALRDTVRYAPASSRFKIYIIDEVHMLTKEAFNALLKTLEEPPEHVKFMFATTEPEKVLATILSRCQRFDLRRIPAALIVKHLASIAAKEGVEIDDAALHAIARGAEGGMRDAESTLDQLISFCGNKIVEAEVLSMFGLAARQQILDLSGAILEGRVEAILRELNALAASGKDLGRLLSDLLNHFRNLLIFQVTGGDANLVEVSEAESAAIKQQTDGATPEAVTRIMEVLSDAEGRLRDASSKKILIEISLLKAVQARQAVSIDAVLSKLRELQNAAGPAPAPAVNPMREPPPAPAPPAQPARSQAPTPPPPAPVPAPIVAEPQASESLEEMWRGLVESASRASAFARAYLIEAHPVSLTKTHFTVGLDPKFSDHFGLLDTPKNRQLLQTKLEEIGHRGVSVRFIQVEAPAGWTRSEAAPELEPAAPREAPKPAAAPAKPAAPAKVAPVTLSHEEFKNDPLIKQALEIFKGQIVEVRA